ncbi:MAG: response regulator [candidate division KSB1 bacterium]|jgi:CheY-like chemotaxis protein|nr:response regulator [candidate division KSB1 bacterium]
MAKKLLLIEDDKAQQLSWKQVFKNWGHYDVVLANDGAEGLMKLPENPDIIILDMKMPKLNGLGFLNKLFTNNKYVAFREIPIIALTVWNDDPTILKAVNEHPNVTLITKEEARKKLIKIIREEIGE